MFRSRRKKGIDVQISKEKRRYAEVGFQLCNISQGNLLKHNGSFFFSKSSLTHTLLNCNGGITSIEPAHPSFSWKQFWKYEIVVLWFMFWDSIVENILQAWVPYDWRLSPSKLEERDLYFHKLKLTFEMALKHHGGPSIVFAHSLANQKTLAVSLEEGGLTYRRFMVSFQLQEHIWGSQEIAMVRQGKVLI
ncbi:hypothetical protein L1987_09572 [Smallanthus sonchifolius]|uniref:Uncharacterized protein n=1 Tax=Smallanthus sonchifolius TaxID=185202 RepID=A0ACB9JP57_9ASTR|nr:hypothetical protein L1987_09572 [Smallanthus sonchifolius]